MKDILTFKSLFKISFIAILAVLLVGVSSCTKNFEKRNTPQNQLIASALDPSLLGQVFARIEYNDPFGYSTNIWNKILYDDFFSQYFANNAPYFQSDYYVFAGVHMDRLWGDFYSTASGPLHYIEDFTTEKNMPLENAIAKIWKVQAYQEMTDAFGPIIYFQAGNGETSVDYDSQKDIYMDFFKVLDTAVGVLKQNPGSLNIFTNNDQIYKGNGDSWLKFANSLRLRVAMRLAYIDPATAQQQAEKAVADGVMTTNADNAEVTCTVNSINGLASSLYHDEWRMSASMYSVLQGWNDPRMAVYFAPVWNGGPARGLRNGLPVSALNPNYYQSYSPIGNTWRSLTSGAWGSAGTNPPMKVMVSSEVYFLRAEGALRGWNMDGTAKDLYNDGITMSLTDPVGGLTVTATQIDAYINGTSLPVPVNDLWNSPPMTNIPVLYQSSGSFETQLEQIITQKWLAIFPDECSESWAERRRTGYPRGYALISTQNLDLTIYQLARRKIFPPGEATVNGPALEKAKALLGGPDNAATRLWWDAKPLNLYPTPAN